MKGSSKILAAMAVLVVMLLSASPAALAQGAADASNVPACAAEFVKCAQNMNTTKIQEHPEDPIECCSIFADLVKNDKKCVCDNFVKTLEAQNAGDILDILFSGCNTKTTPDDLCDGGSSNDDSSSTETPSSSSSSSETTGSKPKLPNGANKITAFALLPSAVLLIWTMVF